MRILPRKDSRDLHFHEKYGQVTEFEDEFIVKDKFDDTIQAPGNVQCTCITTCDIASDADGVLWDVEDLWSRVPHDSTGTNPRMVIKEALDHGFLPVNATSYIRKRVFKSYWSAHTGDMTPFNNVRSALKMTGYPVALWSAWYSEWAFSTIMFVGTVPACYHMYACEGWTKKYGVPMLVISAWNGRKMYISEAEFNKLAKTLGFGSAVLATSEVDTKRTKTLVDAVSDGIDNLLITIQIYVAELLASKKKLQ